MLLFQKLYWIPIFNQYLLNKNDDTCPLLDTNISAWIDLTLKVKKMLWALDGKIRIHVQSSNTSYMRLHSRTSVSLRRLYVAQFLSLHFVDRDEDFLSKGFKDIWHDNKIFSCTMELPNEPASLVVIFICFVSFSLGTNLWPHLSTKNTGKAFIHMAKINCLVTTLYELFNRLQGFFLLGFFLGNQRGNQKKTHFALFGSWSEHKFSCSLAGPTTT